MQSARFLIVDRAEPFRRAIAKYLSALGHQVIEAHGYQDALEVLHGECVDLVLVTLDADLEGLSFLEKVTERPDPVVLPIVVIVSDLDPDILRQLRNRGAKQVLVKAAFSLSELADSVQLALRL
jgi:CheY-like chemotaxis protein